MDAEQLKQLRTKVITAGYGLEISWSESITPCQDADRFLAEYIWVVVSAGIRNDIARRIESKIIQAINNNILVERVFNHQGKANSIQKAVAYKEEYFKKYHEAEDKISYLGSLPWIGYITQFHLAKNLGLDVAKPDRHLERIAARDGRPCQQLCSDLAKETGYRIATVDQILWRASLLGLLPEGGV